MSLSASFRTGWRNVTRQVKRSRAALAAIVFGVASMILATGFIDWNLRFGRDNTIRSQLGHLQIMKPGFLESGRAAPFDYLLPEDAAQALAPVAEVPGVVAVAPRLMIAGLASAGDTTLSFIGEGGDPEAEARLSSALRFTQGRNLAPGEPKTAIVGRGLAENLGIGVGSTVVLLATPASGGINAVEASVVGVFESITKAYDDIALRIPIPLARQLMRTEGEHVRLVLLDDTDRTDAVAQAMQQRLDPARYQITPWHRLADFYNKTAALFAKQVGVIDLIIAIIIVLSIWNTLTMAVMERTGEIGTMMALGARRQDILALFIVEGGIIGVIGALGGVIVGSLAGLLISAIGIPMPPGPGMNWGFEAGIDLAPSTLFKAGAVAVATTALASLYPAWKASRLEIVDALRTRQ